MLIPRLEFKEPLRLECQHFVDCIQDGTVPRSDGKQGLAVVKMLEMADLSLRNGGAVVAVDATVSDRG